MSDESLRSELLSRITRLLEQERDWSGIPGSRFNKRVSLRLGDAYLVIRAKRRGDIDVLFHTPPGRPVFVLRRSYGATRYLQLHSIEHFVLPWLRKHMVLLDMASV